MGGVKDRDERFAAYVTLPTVYLNGKPYAGVRYWTKPGKS